MSEPVETTHEEATRCPKCSQPGKLVNTTRAPAGRGLKRGTKIEMYECVNTRCVHGPRDGMSGERWAIQVNPDGTIPPKDVGRTQPKEFDIDRHTTEAERQHARDFMAQNLARQTREQ